MKGHKTEKKGLRARKREKVWTVDYYPVRRHSRVLYVPLSRNVCDLHDIQKNDLLKVAILEVVRAPRADEENEED